MRKLMIVLGMVLAWAVPVSAQTPIFVGPNTKLAWDVGEPVLGITPATFQGLTYNLSVDGGPYNALTTVTCANRTPVPPELSAATCTVPIAQVPNGSHVITLTAQSAAGTSVPSAPFAYLMVAIPIPTNTRFQ